MNRTISRMLKISLLIFLVTTLIGFSTPINAETIGNDATNTSASITNTTYSSDQEALQLLEKVLQKTETDEEAKIVTTAFLIVKPNLRNPILSSSSTTLKSTSVQDAVNIADTHLITCGTPYVIRFQQISKRKGEDIGLDVDQFLIGSLFSHNLGSTVSTNHFEIHYTDDPTDPDYASPDYVNKVVDYFESKTWTTEIDNWGYKEGHSINLPWPLCTSHDKYQVSIKDIGSLGVTVPSIGCKGSSITIDNGLDRELYGGWLQGDNSLLLGTIAHEYHHASQDEYIDLTGSGNDELWIIEATTTWIEYQVRLQYPTVTGNAEWNLFRSRVNFYQGRPYLGLLSVNATSHLGVTDDYDAGIYAYFLANNSNTNFYPTGAKKEIIREFWEELERKDDWSKVKEAFDAALSGYSFDSSFPIFTKANYFKDRWYPDGSRFTHVSEVPVNLVGITETKTYSGGATVDGVPIRTINQYAAEYFVISAPEQSEIFVTFDGQGNKFFMDHFLNADENNELGPFTSVLSASWVYHEDTASDTVLIIGRVGDSGDGNFTLKFAPIIPNIIKPTQTGPGNVGPHDNPSKTFVEVETKTSVGMFVPGLDKKEYYIVEIGDKAATILNVVEKPDRYVLEVMPPEQDSDGLYGLNVTLGSLSDVETNAINYGAKGVDMALIIDSSGSMEWNDPGDFRKTAAKQFVALANIGDQICVADFGHSGCNSRLLLQSLGITDESSRNTMNAAIDRVVSYGSTPIGYGLQRGYNELSSSRAVASHNKAGILLTDGDDTCNTEGTARTYASSFKSNGWSLYTIALTGAADEAFLNELASLGNGEYAGKAPTNEELHEIYRIISGRVLGEQTTTTVEGTAQQSQTSIETALIDSSVTSAKFAISWPGSDLDLTLERPDGGIIDPDVAAADPGIDYTSAASYEFYAVDSPMAGEWKLKIFGVDVPAEGEDYTGSVMAVTDVTMNIYLDRDEYATGEPIKASVSISDATQPITNATVIADVELPMATTSSSTKALAGKDCITEEEKSELASLRASLQTTSSSLHNQITLFDDGLHGDGIANDGVYANFYTNTSVEGTYKFTAKASGTTNTGEEFTRVAEQSTYVTGASTPEISVTPTTWSFEFEHGISVEKNFTVVSSVDTIASMTATDLTDEFGNVIPSTNISFYPSVLSLSANEPQNFTADITIPQNSHAGNYSGSIIITAPECTLNVEVTITYQLIRSAEFSGVYTDYGDDTNGDGLYDYLTIEVGVDVGETGYYLVEGILYDCYSGSVGWASNHTYLNAGSQMVQLDFNGINIRQNGVDGAYDLKFLYLYDSNWNQSDYVDDAYTTYYYNYTDFQTPPAEFNGVYADYGDDTDGGGTYDYLTIDVGMYVRETGYYQVNGELHDCYGGYVGKISNYAYLNAGNQTVQFNFSGIKIRWNGVDGTYDLKSLCLYADNWNQYIYNAYTTSYYYYTDFQTVPSCYNYTEESVAYAWDVIDTPDQSWTGCDDCSYNYALPWNFTYFGEDHSSIQISTNGLITFPPDTSNHCCSPDFENTEAIAPFWGDLSQACGLGTNISVQNKGDRVVVVWYTGTYGEGCLNKDLFEAILYENGEIRFNYNYLDNIPHLVGAGISNGIVYYTNTWDNGTSVVYSPANETPPTTTISIADANAQSGYSTTTQITINNMTNFGAATVALSYDPDVVQITDIIAGDVGTPIANINNTAGTATMAAYITTATGPDSPITFANLELLAVGNNGETSPLTLIITTLTDADGASVSATLISGIFTVSGLRGDANNDGNVDVVDAMFVAQYAVGNRDASTLNMANADANLDGDVNVVDAMFIAQYAVGARTW